MKHVDTIGWWISCIKCKEYAKYENKDSFCWCIRDVYTHHYVTLSKENAKLASYARFEEILP